MPVAVPVRAGIFAGLFVAALGLPMACDGAWLAQLSSRVAEAV